MATREVGACGCLVHSLTIVVSYGVKNRMKKCFLIHMPSILHCLLACACGPNMCTCDDAVVGSKSLN